MDSSRRYKTFLVLEDDYLKALWIFYLSKIIGELKFPLVSIVLTDYTTENAFRTTFLV